ncbi:MAG: hypothetical protein J6Y19_12260 [Kiritimatiellae bacterium]|nr:hypothetical protein [Kiritimatiellia bacterium]MBP5788572.1 hypothetical protein [Kiritimatiellia bacterium]
MNSRESFNLKRTEPSDKWPHKKLWRGVVTALKALPAHFHSDTFIEGVNATDVFTLNSALGATIENQVVETLNTIRNVWDPENKYGTHLFVRQPQSFPDVVLKNLSDESSPPLMGIELKGWYLLAKEAEPSMRFQQSARACADADVIMVVPWVLNSVISGRPRIFAPFIEQAKYAAEFRNAYWKQMRGGGAEAEIIEPTDAAPYPRKADATNDQPRSDRGKNFGRIARSGLMDEYLERMKVQPVCGIRAVYWLEFFKIFHQDATGQQIESALERLRQKARQIQESEQRRSFLDVISALENHYAGLLP